VVVGLRGGRPCHADATAFPHRQTAFSVLLLGQWSDPADTEAIIAWVRDTFELLQPQLSSVRYTNFLAADDNEVVRQGYGDNYERLVEIKRIYDAGNLFRVNHKHRPSRIARRSASVGSGVGRVSLLAPMLLAHRHFAVPVLIRAPARRRRSWTLWDNCQRRSVNGSATSTTRSRSVVLLEQHLPLVLDSLRDVGAVECNRLAQYANRDQTISVD
jgi:hypothetical protein